MKKAAEDLASDIEKVLGRRPQIVAQAAGPAIEIAAPTGGATESFSIALRGNHVVLSGADMRGTIFAIYSFSQDYLGRRSDVLLERQPAGPARLRRYSGGTFPQLPIALFRYRGFFINDEDQLTGWAPGEATDHSGIARPVMDKIFETILRLKGNMVVPGTWTFSTDPQMKWVSERGLILNQHHAISLGVNVARWPANVPYTYSQHPEILEKAWTNSVRGYDPKQEILWSVGLRGLSDTSYSVMDPSVVGNDKLLGSLISKAIRDQMGIVRAVHPDAKFVTDLWREGAELQRKGLLHSAGSDHGMGRYRLRHNSGQGAVAKGQGMYYHVAMLNGRANQLSEMVPVDRIYSEFGRYIKAGATQYVLLNTSDLRAVSMTTRAVMDTAWGGFRRPARRAPIPDGRQAEFGDKAADAVAKVWDGYFQAIPKLAVRR